MKCRHGLAHSVNPEISCYSERPRFGPSGFMPLSEFFSLSLGLEAAFCPWQEQTYQCLFDGARCDNAVCI